MNLKKKREFLSLFIWLSLIFFFIIFSIISRQSLIKHESYGEQLSIYTYNIRTTHSRVKQIKKLKQLNNQIKKKS